LTLNPEPSNFFKGNTMQVKEVKELTAKTLQLKAELMGANMVS